MQTTNKRYKPNLMHTVSKFNRSTNSCKKANRITVQRGGRKI